MATIHARSAVAQMDDNHHVRGFDLRDVEQPLREAHTCSTLSAYFFREMSCTESSTYRGGVNSLDLI